MANGKSLKRTERKTPRSERKLCFYLFAVSLKKCNRNSKRKQTKTLPIDKMQTTDGEKQTATTMNGA